MALFGKQDAAKKPKVKKFKGSVEGSTLTVSAIDGSGSAQIDLKAIPQAALDFMVRSDAYRRLTGNDATMKEVQERIVKLLAGEVTKPKGTPRAKAPKGPSALAEALANFSKAQGQGINTPETYAKMCDASVWNAKLEAMPKEKRNELRSNASIRTELDKVNMARAKARGKESKAVDLAALVA